MKRTVAIFFLFLFLLNILGYYGVFMGAFRQIAQNAKESFDYDNYQKDAEVTFQIPLTMPYTADMDEYQRVDGEFNHNGETYRLVKQKLTNNMLYIVCVKDAHASTINKALEDYVKTFSDGPTSEKNHSKAAPTLAKDYYSTNISVESKYLGWEFLIHWPEVQVQKVLTFEDSFIQPPRA
jgi:hypothetical protein